MPEDPFDFSLPPELIAQFPLAERDDSRLLVCERVAASIQHARFKDLPALLRPGDLLVVNNTQVIPARLYPRLEGKEKEVEVLLLRELRPLVWECLARPARELALGKQLRFKSGFFWAEVTGSSDEGLREITFYPNNGKSFAEFLKEEGETPLPPYIKRAASPLDRLRYQTVFAEEPGAVAAPTAGLHFTPELLAQLKKQEVDLAAVTLHVGMGTFRPVGEKELQAGKLHPEVYAISAETAEKVNEAVDEGRRVIAVGTTSVRALESAARREFPLKAVKAETDLFIYPPYQFKVVKGLVTNFHLPKSSLLMLVAAFAGHDFTFAAYRRAIEHRYRFYSYGDAMLIL